MATATEIPFARTTCACSADVGNCYRQPGYLGIADLAELRVAESPSLFRQGRAMLGDRLTGATLEIATVVPARRGGKCAFLSETHRCLIHARAPFGCAYFDVHQPPTESDRRSLWMLRQIAGDEDYQRVAASLRPKE